MESEVYWDILYNVYFYSQQSQKKLSLEQVVAGVLLSDFEYFECRLRVEEGY